jgi:hypothetical protein
MSRYRPPIKGMLQRDFTIKQFHHLHQLTLYSISREKNEGFVVSHQQQQQQHQNKQFIVGK